MPPARSSSRTSRAASPSRTSASLRARPRGAARDRPRRARRDDGRSRRPYRRGQVDDRKAARALLRPDGRTHRDRRRRPARRVTQESLRRQLGIVPQEGFLFAGTVAENIAFGRPDATREEIESAARAVGADEFIDRLEHGYETQLGERGSRLSLGQRQLVAFARALLADPRILILDEATSSVDIGTERKIERALRRLLHGRTAFIIAHRLSTIRDADLIVVLEHGQIVEQGTHDELIARRGLYPSLYGDWAERAWPVANRCRLAAMQSATRSAKAGRSTSASGGTCCRSRSSSPVISLLSLALAALGGVLRCSSALLVSIVGRLPAPGGTGRGDRRRPRRTRRPDARRDASAGLAADRHRRCRRRSSRAIAIAVGFVLCHRAGPVPDDDLERGRARGGAREGRGVSKSFGRSRALVRGYGWTVFGVIAHHVPRHFVVSIVLELVLPGSRTASPTTSGTWSRTTVLAPFVAAGRACTSGFACTSRAAAAGRLTDDSCASAALQRVFVARRSLQASASRPSITSSIAAAYVGAARRHLEEHVDDGHLCPAAA